MYKMLATGQPQYVELFVTYILEDGPLLKIYGQLDRAAAIFVEKVILQYSEQFERGVGSIFPGSLSLNSLCCAKYGGDGVYYRAKVVDVSSIHQGIVRVNFIDYGNSDIVNVGNIRSVSGMQNSPLCSVPGQVTEFVLGGIVPPMGNAWESQTVEFIKDKLCYAEFKCAVVAQFSGRKFIKLYYNGHDFAEVLVQKNLALHISLQSQQNMLQNLHQYSNVPSISYSVLPPVQQNYPSTSASLLVKAAAITKQESGVISAPLLTVGSKHTIYISYIEDGPYLFAIQLKSTENILQNMTKSFSQLMLKPFSQSPIPGSVCVTLLTNTQVLCRAVVTNIMENECVVYCVDFGNTETVPFSQIYEVPSQFLNTKSLAMRFSLAGIQNTNFNDKAKRIFQELVMGETLLLEVVEPEGPPLKQYGNIYFNGENIVTLLKERLKSFEKPKAYPPLPAIQPGRIVNVTVSFVESVNEFYVQYDANSRALKNIMTTMEQFCANSAAMIRHDDMYAGMPVCALFSVDQKWYRAKVVSASVNEIVVFHVDYGSTDTVSLVSLRHMDPTLLQCQAQAVQCALSGFQDYAGSLDDVSIRLEELTLERKLTMKILSHLPNGKLLVELHDTTVAPVQNVAEQIKKPIQSSYETPIDEWCDPAAAGEPAAAAAAAAALRSAPFGGREKRFPKKKENKQKKNSSSRKVLGKFCKFEEGGGEGWRPDSKRSGGWNESQDGNKRWGNKDDRTRGDKKWNRNNQANEENQWRKEGNDVNDNWDNAGDNGRKFEREDNRRGKDVSDWRNKENRRGLSRGGDDWKDKEYRGGFNKDGDNRQERDSRYSGFNEGDDSNARENRRGFGKGDDWKERDGNRRGFNKDDDWKEKENRRGFNREGGDWKDRDGGRQGFRDGDNRRGFNRDGGDRNRKKYEDGNQEGKKWWGHDDRSEPGKWESRDDRREEDKWGGRDKHTSNAGEFKKWNDGGYQRGGGGREGGSSWKGSARSGGGGGDGDWDTNDKVQISATAVDSWDASDGLSSMGDKNKLAYPEPSVSLGSKLNVTLVSAEDPTNFVVQIDDKIPDVTKIMEEIASTYDSGGNVIPETDQKITMACIARYPLDEVWYRAVITKAPINETTEVNFVDYGNSMEVPSSDIKEITPELKSIPPFGIPCSLFAAKVPITEWTQELIDEFLNLADGKKLEAHFINKTGPIFELVLVDTADSSSSINEHFGATKDSIEAGITKIHRQKKSFQFENSLKSNETQEEYATSEDTYQIADISSDVVETVSVGWFIDPDQFYCQRNSSKAEFTSMVNEIQSAYKKRTPYKGDLKIGQPVIAQFPADKVLYRAEIIDVKGLKYQVQYIDYGNMELLAPCHLWHIEKRFLSLPKQGILCALKGVQPKDSEWPKDSPEFEKYFGIDNIECTFHGLVNGKYSVSLSVNGLDVAKELVSSGLANEKVEEKVHLKKPLALNLLRGQQVLTHVTYIESISKFFVHLDPVSAKSIQEKVEKHAESAKTSTPPTDLVEHQMCLATPDGTEWYRGKIADIPSPDEVCINFVDFGDSHVVPLNQVRLLPDSLLGYRPQATECMVFGCNVSEGNDKTMEESFKAEVEEQDVIIRIEEINNERLVVHLFDVEGHCLELLKKVDTSTPLGVEALCPMPILTNTESMWVSHVDGTNTLWLQKENEADILSGLLELLFTFYEEEKKGIDLGIDSVEGQLCAAKSKDGSWYRGRISSVSDEQITVYYIDFGNCETLSKLDVKELDPSFCGMHALSVRAFLPVNVENNEGFLSELETATAETLFDVSFAKSDDSTWYVHLENDKLHLVHHLCSSGVATEIQHSLFLSDNVCILDNEKIDVCISHYESPSQFWIQKDSNFVDTLDLQESLQLIGSSQAVLSKREIGSLCIAQFTDELWYRAKIVENNENNTKVFFLDYGNIYDVETASLRKLPVKFFRWPYYAVQCCLSDVSFLDSEEQLEKCSLVLSETETVFQLQRVDEGDPVPVSLYIGEKDLRTVISETELPKELTKGEDNLQVDSEVKDVESLPVLVSHICSPAKFWIQYENSSPALEEMADALVNAEGFEQILNPEVGMLYAALFEDDEQWYRAKVLEICEDTFYVLFIDYGNSSIVTDLRKLPEELVNMPSIAKCCRLQFPPGIESWSVDADKKFVDMSGEGSVQFQMELCSDEEPWEVILKIEGKNVCDIISELPQLPVVPQSSKGSSVLISHINSPSDFWVQWESESEKLDSIAEKLLEAENYETLNEYDIGIVCAAQFSDDELWYRAKIISFEAQSTKVLFIDYGNVASVTVLRRLPEELLIIPGLAVHCSLPLPKGCKNWPDKATEEFFTIFGDGANSYDIIMLEEGERSVVSLKLNNEKVEEILQKGMGLLSEELSSDKNSCVTSSTDVEILTESDIIIDPNEPVKPDEKIVEGREKSCEISSEFEKKLEEGQVGEPEETKCSGEKLVTAESGSLLVTEKGEDTTQESLKQIENNLSSSKNSIEHREEIIKDLKVELLVQEDARKIGHSKFNELGSIARALLEEPIGNVEKNNKTQYVFNCSDLSPKDSSERNLTTQREDVEGDPLIINTLNAEEPVLEIRINPDILPETSGELTPCLDGSVDEESKNVSSDLETSLASTTCENANKTNESNESQSSADTSGSQDDSSSSNCTIIDNDNQSTGCIDMSDTKYNYQIASLHKTEELYETSKTETKSCNVNTNSHRTPK